MSDQFTSEPPPPTPAPPAPTAGPNPFAKQDRPGKWPGLRLTLILVALAVGFGTLYFFLFRPGGPLSDPYAREEFTAQGLWDLWEKEGETFARRMSGKQVTVSGDCSRRTGSRLPIFDVASKGNENDGIVCYLLPDEPRLKWEAHSHEPPIRLVVRGTVRVEEGNFLVLVDCQVLLLKTP